MIAAKLWPLAIVGVLAITVGANAWILYEANRDPNATVVEPDYYRKAVAYDSTLAQARRDRALGWRLAAEPGAFDPNGTPLALALTDREGLPIAGASVALVAIHNLDAGRLVSARLVTGADGRATGRLGLDRTGLWELRFDARRGAERFTTDLRCDVAGRGR
jgi:nitrogen fixation protein FixH